VIASVILWGVVAPVLVAAGLSAAAQAFKKRTGRATPPVEGFFLWAGYSTAYAGLAGWPPFPPVEATQWLVVLLFAVAWVPVMETRMEKPALRAMLRMLFAFAIVGVLLKPRAEIAWSVTEGLSWLLGWSLSLSLGWMLMSTPEPRRHSDWSAIPMLVGMAGANIALFLSGSALLAQLGGAGATILLGLTLMNSTGRGSIPQAVVGPLICLIFCLVVLGQTYAYLPLASACLLLASFCSVGVWRIPLLADGSPGRIVAAQLIFVAGFSAAAIFLIPAQEAASAGPW